MLKYEWFDYFDHVRRGHNFEADMLVKCAFNNALGFHLIPLYDFHLFLFCNVDQFLLLFFTDQRKRT